MARIARSVIENRLLDSYEKSGNTLEGLKATTKELTQSTDFITMHSGDLHLISLHSTTEIDVPKLDKDGNVVCNANGTPKTVKKKAIYGIKLEPGKLPTEQFFQPIDKGYKPFAPTYTRHIEAASVTPELLDEWTRDTKLALMFNGEDKQFHFTSRIALRNLERFGLSGTAIMQPSFARDLMVAHQFQMDKPVTLIVRRAGNARKVFSIMSGKYTPIDQNIMFKVVKQIEKSGCMGTPVCHEWRVNNFFTKLFIEFPDKADELSTLYKLPRKMIPGVLLTTSDTGDSSFKVAGTWRVEGSNAIVVNNEVRKKHTGDSEITKLMKDVEEQIFAEYEKLPAALCELMQTDITEPKWNLLKEEDQEANAVRIEKTVKFALKELGMVSAIGKKLEVQLREQLLNDFSPALRYTAYDFAITLMQLPERVSFSGKKRDNMANLQKACARAPFIRYIDDDTVTIED